MYLSEVKGREYREKYNIGLVIENKKHERRWPWISRGLWWWKI